MSIGREARRYLDDDFVTVEIPSGRIFHETDFDVADFEDEAAAAVRRFGGESVSSHMVSARGVWQITLSFPKDVRRDEVRRAIERLPEGRLAFQYGAKVVFPYPRAASMGVELLKVAKALVAGDEWADEQTYEFAKQVAKEIQRDGHMVHGASRNVVEFDYRVKDAQIPLDLTLMEFGYGGRSESVNGRVTSPENRAFRVPGGFTRTRDPKGLWKEARRVLEDIFRRAGVGR